jgi:hypothetical protein
MNGVYFIFITELPSKSGMNDEGLNTTNLDDDDEQDSNIFNASELHDAMISQNQTQEALGYTM